MDNLESVTTYYGNPFIQSLAEAHAYLANFENGSAIAFQGKLLVKIGTGFKEIDLATIDPRTFISSASVNQATDSITTMLSKYANLANIKNYLITVLTPGQTIEIPFTSSSKGKIGAFVVSNKTSQYFDFEMRFSNNKMICYSKTAYKGFKHSGDIGSLLHHVTFGDITEEPFILDVVGYSRTPLHKFVNQHPAVILVDHVAETMYIVPCPLDKATIGENCFAGLVVGKRMRDMIRYTVLPSPVTMGKVNTGDCNSTTKITVDTTIQNTIDMWNNPVTAPATDPVADTNSNTDTVTTDTTVPANPCSTDVPSIKYLQFVEQGLSENVMPGNGFIFGTGLEFVADVQSSASATQDKPIACLSPFGCAKGASTLALATGYNFSTGPMLDLAKYCSMIEGSNVVMVYLSEQWSEQVIGTCDTLINGIYIVKSSTNLSGKNLEDHLNDVNIAGVSAMAGPNSIVLIEVGNKLFWYKGVRYPGLIPSTCESDMLPNFGTDMTDILHPAMIQTYAETTSPPFPSIYKRDMSVFWKGSMLHPDTVADIISKMSIEEIGESVMDITDCMTQLQVIFDTEKLLVIANRMVSSLNTLADRNIEVFKKVLSDMFQNDASMDTEEAKQVIIDMKAAKKAINKKIKPLINKLGQLVSLRSSSKRSFNLKQMQRKAKIYGNVDAAKNMTMEEKMDLLDEHCDELGVLLSCVNSNLLPIALKAVSDGNYLEYMSDRQDSPESKLMSINDRTQYLDACTVGVMMEIAESNPSYKNHPLVSITDAKSIAIPQGTDYAQSRISCVPFALVDKYVNLKDVSTLYPVTVCNDPEFSMFRILTRGTIVASTISRKSNCNISPASKDLGFLIVDMVLGTMESLATQFSKYPDPTTDFNNTTCQLMRGLFGQLLTLLASGVRPMSMAWQLVMKNPNLEVPKNEEWPIYVRMTKLFPYTCWDPSNIMKNIKTLIIRTIRKRIVNKTIEPMLKEIQKLNAQTQMDNIEARNRELKFLKLAIEVLCHIRNIGDQNDSAVTAIAVRLLEQVPEMNAKSGTEQIIAFFKHVSAGTVDWNRLDSTMQTALNIFTKRSAAFQKFKKEMAKVVESGNDKKMSRYIDTYTQFKESLRQKYQSGYVKVQNEKAINSKDVNSLKSDAEINRTPWSITNEAIDEHYHENILNMVITGNHASASQEDEKSSSVSVRSVAVDKIKKAITGVPMNDRALALYDMCQTNNIRQSLSTQVPITNMLTMMDFVDIADSDKDSVLISIMMKFLENWREDAIQIEKYIVGTI